MTPDKAEATLRRYAAARQILINSAPPLALWFLAGNSVCCLHAGLLGPMLFEDDRESELVTEFLQATAPTFKDYKDASIQLLSNPTMRVQPN